MKRLLVDMSSICWTALLAGKDEEYGLKVEHEGRVIQVNSAVYGYENAINHLISSMNRLEINTKNLVLVVEGMDSKLLRTSVLPAYKSDRSSRPPEAYAQFNLLKNRLVDSLLDCGATAVTQNGLEADDVIAYLAKNLDGERYILSADKDLAVLVGGDVHMLRSGEIDQNPWGPFPHRFITTCKALIGGKDGLKGAKGFGEKAWLDLCAIFGDDGLELLEGLIINRQLDRLSEDVGDLKALQKIIDDKESVYRSWDCALLYPDRVKPVMLERSDNSYPQDERLSRWFGAKAIDLELPGSRTSKDVSKRPFHAVFDTEIIGAENPVFLCCTEVVETGERHAFWQHVEGDMERMKDYFAQPDITFVSFNGIGFDTPVMSAAASGVSTYLVKRLATQLIEDVVTYWDAHKSFDFKPMKFDQIDISEVVPGVRVSLKTYAGRMGYPTMQDMPIPHDVDPTPEQLPIIESYCFNDCGVTKALFLTQQTELDLRREISVEHGIDVRSKSDPQVAEAVMRVELGLGKSGQSVASVRYKAPDFIKTDNEVLNSIIAKLEAHEFTINKMNGQVEAPDFLKDPIKLGSGSYQFGVGGIHSTHDEKVCVWATENTLISDLDVSSYYPSLILRGGFVPKFEGDKGEKFLEIYGNIVRTRIAEKKRIEVIESEIAKIEKELSDG